MIFVGIDGSFIKMGVCIKWETGRLELCSGSMRKCFDFMNEKLKDKDYCAVVENTNLNAGVFGGWEKMLDALKRCQRREIPLKTPRGEIGKTESVESVFRILLKKAQGVGKTAQACTHIIEEFQKKGIRVLEISPRERDRAEKGMTKNDLLLLKIPTKTTAPQFQLLTGYKDRSSYDSRDAAILVYNMTLPKFNLNYERRRK